MGKRELMENFDDWVTDPHITLAGLKQDLLDDPSRIGSLYRGQYLVVTTSGSTGEPAVLVHDRTSQLVASLLGPIRERRTLMAAKEARAFLRRGLRAAALIADGDHFAGVVLTEAARRRSPRIARRVRVFSVLRPLPDLVADLNDFQPTVLYGYPSAMVQLAAEQKAGRLRIHPLLAVASGESLAAHAAAEIEAALGCRVTVRYLASEALALTSRCRQGLLHVNADWNIVEPVDDAFRPVPPGELSHTVLVTNLANRVQPLIRYNLGDRVQLAAGPCACGSPFPTLRVEGRSGDVLSFAAADGARSDGARSEGTGSDGTGLDGTGLDGDRVGRQSGDRAAVGAGHGDRGDRRRPPVPGDPHRAGLAHRAARAVAGGRDGGRAGRRWGSVWGRSSRPRAPPASTSGLAMSRPGRTAAASSARCGPPEPAAVAVAVSAVSAVPGSAGRPAGPGAAPGSRTVRSGTRRRP